MGAKVAVFDMNGDRGKAVAEWRHLAGWAMISGYGAMGALDRDGPKRVIPRLPGAVAQLVERLVRNEKVSGSIPLGSTRNLRHVVKI